MEDASVAAKKQTHERAADRRLGRETALSNVPIYSFETTYQKLLQPLALGNRYSRTVVVRVDLHYLSVVQARLRVEEAFADQARLAREIESSSIFDHLTGYICSVEYNNEHRHSQIRFVTPSERHRKLDHQILARRHELYEQARKASPERWSGQTRKWKPVGTGTAESGSGAVRGEKSGIVRRLTRQLP